MGSTAMTEHDKEPHAPIGIRHLADQFDHFIIDQWGVLHDGERPYEGAVECLAALQRRGKQVVLLSNSSIRREASCEALARLGFSADLFNDVVTSGELAWRWLKEQSARTTPQPLRVFVIGREKDDAEYVRSAGGVISGVEEADLVLARGTFAIWEAADRAVRFERAEELLAAVAPWLQRCAARGLPMLVSNPDYYRPGCGSPMPGQLARQYHALGGEVRFFGKPHPEVYNASLNLLAAATTPRPLAPARVCAVGDSLEHDVGGARRAGLASVWTCNGVHCGDLGTEEGSPALPDPDRLAVLYTRHNV
eukprot:EG_transcript_13129